MDTPATGTRGWGREAGGNDRREAAVDEVAVRPEAVRGVGHERGGVEVVVWEVAEVDVGLGAGVPAFLAEGGFKGGDEVAVEVEAVKVEVSGE